MCKVPTSLEDSSVFFFRGSPAELSAGCFCRICNSRTNMCSGTRPKKLIYFKFFYRLGQSERSHPRLLPRHFNQSASNLGCCMDSGEGGSGQGLHGWHNTATTRRPLFLSVQRRPRKSMVPREHGIYMYIPLFARSICGSRADKSPISIDRFPHLSCSCHLTLIFLTCPIHDFFCLFTWYCR